MVAKLIYTVFTSLDAYIENEEGKFDWAITPTWSPDDRFRDRIVN